MNKNCGIYKITSPNGRVYIGQSKNLKRRRNEYKLESKYKLQPKLYNSILKYGVENHQFDVIEYCSEEDLNCSERFWQDEFDVLNGGLNCLLIECGEKRKINSKETTQKLREATRGENNPNYGKKWSEEHKNRMSAMKIESGAAKGENNPMFGKIGELHPRFGKKWTENQRNKSVLKGADHKNSKIVYCEQTGIFFDTVREAAETYGYNKHTLAAKLRGEFKNNTSLRYA